MTKPLQEKRVIKFRAWDKEAKMMVDVGYDIGSVLAQKSLYEVMQFTGLHDKNGKEIFEGDVVRGRDCGGREKTEVVEYRDCAFRPLGIDAGCGDQEMTGPEVIGNIYENPELLTDKSV